MFVAIDRATRWVYVAIKRQTIAATEPSFPQALHKSCPTRIRYVLTDNGKEFTDRLFTSREREPSGEHEFDQLCEALDIEHRLTRLRTPRTNGMVERLIGRIAGVLKTHRFFSSEDLDSTHMRYVTLYNHPLPQSTLNNQTPIQSMQHWYRTHLHLFHRRHSDR